MTETGYPSSEVVAVRLNDLANLSRRLAHDFDNILTGVVGFAELSLPHIPHASPPHRYLKQLLRVAEQGIQLTQRLHQFHQAGLARPVPSDVTQALQSEVERFRQTLPAAQKCDVEVAGGLPWVRIDGELLRQALAQVLANAGEACPTEGAIRVNARRIDIDAAESTQWIGSVQPGPHVVISVTDTGAGIAAETRARLIAVPLFTTKSKHRGLGLPLAFRILQAHAGGIRFETPAEEGCTVRMVVPAVSEKE